MPHWNMHQDVSVNMHQKVSVSECAPGHVSECAPRGSLHVTLCHGMVPYTTTYMYDLIGGTALLLAKSGI